MPRLTLKLPRKLHRVEIIRGKDIRDEDYFAYLPLDKMPAEEQLQEIFEAEIAELRNESLEQELFTEQDIPIINKFYQEVQFTEQLKPVQISLDKLPEDVMPLAEVKIQIQEAYERGFKDGQEVTSDYFAEEMSKHAEWVRKFDVLSIKLRQQYAKELMKMEEAIISLGLMSAEHIIKQELSYNSQLTINLVKNAIAEAENDTIFKILVNSENYSILESVKSSLLQSPADSLKIELQADDSVDAGGCILDTAGGIIDARIKTQLNTIKEKLSELPTTPLQELELSDSFFDGEEFL
jgi:flagellar biosynthesis/type III secretory pathway protein FliH